jgi:hypothetical protein
MDETTGSEIVGDVSAVMVFLCCVWNALSVCVLWKYTKSVRYDIYGHKTGSVRFIE